MVRVDAPDERGNVIVRPELVAPADGHRGLRDRRRHAEHLREMDVRRRKRRGALASAGK